MTERRDEVAGEMEAAFAAFAAGDMEGATAAMHPDVEIHAAPEAGNPGDFRGSEGFGRWARLWLDAWDEFRQQVVGVEMLEADVAVIDARQIASGAGSGVAVERDVYWAIEFRDGRARRVHLYANREQAVAAAERFRAEPAGS